MLILYVATARLAPMANILLNHARPRLMLSACSAAYVLQVLSLCRLVERQQTQCVEYAKFVLLANISHHNVVLMAMIQCAPVAPRVVLLNIITLNAFVANVQYVKHLLCIWQQDALVTKTLSANHELFVTMPTESHIMWTFSPTSLTQPVLDAKIAQLLECTISSAVAGIQVDPMPCAGIALSVLLGPIRPKSAPNMLTLSVSNAATVALVTIVPVIALTRRTLSVFHALTA